MSRRVGVRRRPEASVKPLPHTKTAAEEKPFRFRRSSAGVADDSRDHWRDGCACWRERASSPAYAAGRRASRKEGAVGGWLKSPDVV